MNRQDLKRLIKESFEQISNKQKMFSDGLVQEEDPGAKWKELTERSIDPGNPDFKEMVMKAIAEGDVFPHVLEALLSDEHEELRNEIYKKLKN